MAIFNQISSSYDQWYESKIGKFADQVETECAFSLFQIKPGMHILDIGCGTGNFSIKLAKKGAIVTGIDISENMLSIACKKAAKENLTIHFRTMDSLNLKFPDRAFDGVFSMAAIEFVIDDYKMIEEMFRVCKTGGPILVGTINRDSAWGKLYQDPEYQKKVPVFQHAYLKSPEDLMQLQKQSFVAIKECLYISPDSTEEEISEQQEVERSKTNRGGYFCILWKKF